MTSFGRIQIVFSRRPDGVSEEDWNTWYDAFPATSGDTTTCTACVFVSLRNNACWKLTFSTTCAP